MKEIINTNINLENQAAVGGKMGGGGSGKGVCEGYQNPIMSHLVSRSANPLAKLREHICRVLVNSIAIAEPLKS